MSSSNEELHRYLAKEQNALDHITRKIYGKHVKFENLSPFGQHTVEALARERAVISDPDPELRHAKMEAANLRHENTELEQKLKQALNENQDLWEKNEELMMEIYEQENSSGRSQRRGED